MLILSSGQGNVASRTKLVGKQVYNPDGTLIGSIQEVVLPVGEGEISLQLLTKPGNVQIVAWTNVGAVGDIVLLKKTVELKGTTQEASQPASNLGVEPTKTTETRGGLIAGLGLGKTAAHKCPTCGNNLRWIKQYQRWYCDKESKYAPE